MGLGDLRSANAFVGIAARTGFHVECGFGSASVYSHGLCGEVVLPLGGTKERSIFSSDRVVLVINACRSAFFYVHKNIRTLSFLHFLCCFSHKRITLLPFAVCRWHNFSKISPHNVLLGEIWELLLLNSVENIVSALC